MAQSLPAKSCHVFTIDLTLAPKLKNDLTSKGFGFSTPAYTIFSAKSSTVSCTLYQSGKLTVQGKGAQEFIEFYLEPEVLQSFEYTHNETRMKAVPLNFSPHIGIDESGKGDLFGALCIAGVFANETQAGELKKIGVRDSKLINDQNILSLCAKIKNHCAHHIVKINPKKYNELYLQFKNLNFLLAWGHATAIEQLVEKTGCQEIIIDQFANESVVLTALKRKNLKLNLTQRHRGEEDIVVAAASILARGAFLDSLKHLSSQFEITLPKGASSNTINVGKEFVRKHGRAALPDVAKMHFKTIEAI